MQKHDVFQEMADRWPSAVVARREVGTFTGGLIKPKYLANQDSLKLGPSERIEAFGRVAYPVSSFVDWLRNRANRA